MSDVDRARDIWKNWSDQKKKEFISLVGKSLEESLNPKQSHIEACKKYYEEWKKEQSVDPYSDKSQNLWNDFFSESLHCAIDAAPMLEEARDIVRSRKK